MSTRSVQNKRTQEKMQGESRGGMARKSASSAKPARAAASSVRVVPASAKAKRAAAERGEDLSNLSKEEKKARKAELRRQEDLIYTAANALLKENEDYTRLRRIWWVLLGVGIAALVGTWVLLAVRCGQLLVRPDGSAGAHHRRVRCDHHRVYLRLREDPPHPQCVPRHGVWPERCQA